MRTLSFLGAGVVLIVVACGGSKGGSLGPGGGSALCGVNGTDQCHGGQTCSATLGCVDCITSSDCSQPAPLCDTTSGQCVACNGNGDCGAAAPSCWPGDHQCHAACATNGDCPHGTPICDASSGGVCVQCNASSDCAGTQDPICDTTSGTCVACGVNSDCPATAPRCFAPAGQCVECLSNADCGAARPICDSHDFTCRPGCTSNSDCGGGGGGGGGGDAPLCDTTTSTCVQCLGNADCANDPGKICADDGTCVVCQASSDCPSAAPICHADQCVECFGKNGCAAGQTCVAGTCQ